MSQIITKDMLHRRALYYLERYAASADGVRRVLTRALAKKKRDGIDVPDEADTWVSEIITALIQKGYLNDKTFAEMKIRSLRRQGTSTSRLKQKLRLKGVSGDDIDFLLGQEDPELGSEENALLAFARKKKIGPYGPASLREERKEKHLAALCRAGFSLTLSRRLLAAATVDELESDFEVDSEM